MRETHVTFGVMTEPKNPVKLAFSKRLNEALDDIGAPPKFRGRQNYLRQMFSFSLTQKGARKWLEGESMPRLSRMPEVSHRVGVNLEWLAAGRGEKKIGEGLANGSSTLRAVPVVEWADMSRLPSVLHRPLGQTLPCPVACGDQTFCLRVTGAAMAPRFREGEYIFVDPDVRPISGSYVVARVGGECLLRRLGIDGSARYLQAEAIDWPNRMVQMAQTDTIIGVVIFKGEELR